MSEADIQDSPELQNESDLTAAFGALAALSNHQARCSTMRKQKPRAENAEEAPVRDADPAGEEQPASATPASAATIPPPLPPDRPTRRKQLNPMQRAAQFKRQVRALQRSSQFMIPRLPFGRVVRQIMLEHTTTPYRITVGALEALQTASEMFLTQRFQDSYLMTLHRSRVTLEVRDMALMAFICKLHGQL